MVEKSRNSSYKNYVANCNLLDWYNYFIRRS